MQFYLPASIGEWLAFASAVVTVLFGLVLLFAPRLSLNLLRLRTAEGVPDAVAEARATMAGFYLGVGLSALLFAQPFLWMALGAGWGFTAIGRLVSMLADRGFTRYNGISIGVETLLAVLPLGYVFGYL